MKKFFKILLIVIACVVFIGTFFYLYQNSKGKETVYDLRYPSTESIERTTVLTGKIEPRDEIDIKPQISGIISEILVEAGDHVNNGDIIAKIKVIPEQWASASATLSFVGAILIFSFAFSYLPSIASRPANLPRREALNGAAIGLPSSPRAKYTSP